MRFLVLGWLVLSAALLVRAEPVDRIEADRRAKDAFLKLNFFAEGDGMHMSPDLVNLTGQKDRLGVADTYRHRWGLNLDANEQPIGFFREKWKQMDIGVMGCVVCHSGRAAGIFVPGLGNKNIDVLQLGRDVLKTETAWKKWTDVWVRKDAEYHRVENAALSFASFLAQEPKGNLTQGMVPVAMIRDWFFRIENVPYPAGTPRGAVKVPSLWGYGEKRKVGQFCDGLGDGSLPGWAVAVELVGGQRPEVVRAYRPKIDQAEGVLADFLPPKYPFGYDPIAAITGNRLFARNCAGCHGTYQNDSAVLPIYEAPKWVAWETVRTDRDRIDGNSPLFRSLVDRSPLNDLIKQTALPDGYLASRLVGIWARFPYLHHGGVPSIAALLTPPARRPRVWSLRDAGERTRFDAENLGLTVPAPGSKEEAVLLKKGRAGDRDVYLSERVGHSSQGHDFHTDLAPDEKHALIEYLKSL